VTRYASLVLDVDSTVSRIEGIEWLSQRCEEAVRQRIQETTDAAMRGDIPLEAVYGERLQLVQPTRSSVEELSQAYVDAITPGAVEAVREIQKAGVRIVLVSGGLREAIVPLGAALGVKEEDVKAVPIQFHSDGTYAGYDTSSPLAARGGKPKVVAEMQLASPSFALGDGITDAELKGVVTTFAAFVGIVRHEPVVQAADYVLTSFHELPPLILS
jgi:phosphoserine phosphatase